MRKKTQERPVPATDLAWITDEWIQSKVTAQFTNHKRCTKKDLDTNYMRCCDYDSNTLFRYLNVMVNERFGGMFNPSVWKMLVSNISEDTSIVFYISPSIHDSPREKFELDLHLATFTPYLSFCLKVWSNLQPAFTLLFLNII